MLLILLEGCIHGSEDTRKESGNFMSPFPGTNDAVRCTYCMFTFRLAKFATRITPV